MKCKITIIFLLIAALTKSQIITEAPDSVDKLFSFKKIKSAAYVQFDASVAMVAKKAAMFTGVNLGWILQNKFVVNVFRWEMLTTRHDTTGMLSGDYTKGKFLRYSYMGWGFGYIFFNNKKFSLHPEINGGINLYPIYPNGRRKTYAVGYGTIIPSIQAVFNAHKNFRLGIFINYRQVIGASKIGIPDKNLSGPGGGIFLRFGTFYKE